MKLQISINTGKKAKQQLLAGLQTLLPAYNIVPAAAGIVDGPNVLIFTIDSEEPDTLLQQIAALITEIEQRYPAEQVMEMHVRNPDSSEPDPATLQHGVPFSPVTGIRIVPWIASRLPEAAGHDILLEPAQAFGSGSHPSTRLCLYLLKRSADLGLFRNHAECSVLDIGCGSGILGIAALRLGAARVLGVEIDPAAAEVARRNMQINGFAHAAKIVTGSWQNISGSFDLVLANLVPSVLFRSAAGMASLLNEAGLLVTAGFPAAKNKTVLKLFAQNGFRLLEETAFEGWGGLLLAQET